MQKKVCKIDGGTYQYRRLKSFSQSHLDRLDSLELFERNVGNKEWLKSWWWLLLWFFLRIGKILNFS